MKIVKTVYPKTIMTFNEWIIYIHTKIRNQYN